MLYGKEDHPTSSGIIKSRRTDIIGHAHVHLLACTVTAGNLPKKLLVMWQPNLQIKLLFVNLAKK